MIFIKLFAITPLFKFPLHHFAGDRYKRYKIYFLFVEKIEKSTGFIEKKKMEKQERRPFKLTICRNIRKSD